MPGRRLPELVYEDLEDLPKATQDVLHRLLQIDPQQEVTIWPDVHPVLHRYINMLRPLELQLRIRPIGDDVHSYERLILYQHAHLGLRASNALDVANDLKIPTDALYRGWSRVEDAVFVDVRERVEDRQRVFCGAPDGVPALRIPALVRLEALDDLNVASAGTLQMPTSLSREIGRAHDDRKLSSLIHPTVALHHDEIGKVVESGSGIVDEVPEDNGPVRRNVIKKPDAELVKLRWPRLVLSNKAVRVVLEPDSDVVIERIGVRLRPVDLQSDPVKLVEVSV